MLGLTNFAAIKKQSTVRTASLGWQRGREKQYPTSNLCGGTK